MRSTMLALIGVTAMAACGSSPPPVQTDGGVSKDLTAPEQDMVKKPKYKPNCGVVQSDPQTNFALSSAASQALYQAVLTCIQNTCGLIGVTDGGWNGKACATEVDGGASGACEICINNSQVNSSVNFIDANGNKIECLPDTSSPTCKACEAQLIACFDDPCTDTKDCDGFTFGMAHTPAVCDLDASSSTFGTCQPQP